MYGVSDDYISKIAENGRLTRVTGTITLETGLVIKLDNDSFAKNPEITNQCVGSSELTLGQAYQGQLTLSVYSTISRYLIYGAEVELSFGLCLDEDADTWEEVPLGHYFVSECERTANDILKITALDIMENLDVDIGNITTTGTAYGILTYACTACGVEFGMSEEEVEALPNGGLTYGLPSSHRSQTWRDVVGDMAACLAGFAYIGRDGCLYVKSFSTDIVRSIPDSQRYKDTVSDYQVIYSSVTCEKNGSLISSGTDAAQNLDLEDNDFLQFGLDSTVQSILDNILAVFTKLVYTPAEISWYGDPALDLGDLLEATGYAAGTTTSIPLQIFTWKYRGTHKITAVGKNPKLGEAKSKTDKALENLKNSSSENALSYYTYVNTDEIELGTESTPVLRLSFAVTESTIVTMWHEFNLLSELSDSTQEVYIEYYLDGTLQGYAPIHTYGESGDHLLGTQYWINTDASKVHIWEVRMSISSGTAVLGVGDVHALLTGQKMSASVSWDGILTLVDEYTAASIIDGIVAVTSDNCSITFQTPTKVTASDEYSTAQVGSDVVAVASDSMTLICQWQVYTRVTEDSTDDSEVSRITEDGESTRLTQGG